MNPRWRLSYAKGYVELGMLEAAESELDQLSGEWCGLFDALSLRAVILHAREEWLLLAPLAGELVAKKPDNAGLWITWAYASRRSAGIQSADAILREAELRHPTEPTIQFNLGCYACQQGNLTEALRRVRRAIELEASFAQSARTDPDLAPLREQGLL